MIFVPSNIAEFFNVIDRLQTLEWLSLRGYCPNNKEEILLGALI